MRGVIFEPQGQFMAVRDPHMLKAAHETIPEVATWLGFRDNYDYLSAMSREHERVFERATY